MKYKSVNELNQFKFLDAAVVAFQEKKDSLELELEAVVVKGSHPQNEMYTDRYADTLTMRLMQGKIVKGFLEGFKYYDADGKLLKENPDEALLVEELRELLPTFGEGHIFVFEAPIALKEKLGGQYPDMMADLLEDKNQGKNDGDASDETVVNYIMAIDLDETEQTDAKTYWLALSFSKAILEWNHLMNKPE